MRISKTRAECVAKLMQLMDEGPEKPVAWHFGFVELKEFMDWLFEGPPKTKEEMLFRYPQPKDKPAYMRR